MPNPTDINSAQPLLVDDRAIMQANGRQGKLMNWTNDTLNAAKMLIAAYGILASISSTDIHKQAQIIYKYYPDVSLQRIRDQISEDIKTLRR